MVAKKLHQVFFQIILRYSVIVNQAIQSIAKYEKTILFIDVKKY